MSGLRRNQTGIASIVLIAGAAIAIVIVLVGIFTLFSSGGHKNNNATTNTNGKTANANTITPSTGATQDFTSSDKVFTVGYPKGWTAKTQVGQNGMCNGVPACISQTTISLNSNVQVVVLESAIYASAKSWFNQTMSPVPADSSNVSSTSINGYDTYRDTIKAPAFTAAHAVMANVNYVVDIHFQYVTKTLAPDGVTVTSQQDESKYLPQYEQIVQSINFHKD
jgi:hypothetical protein